MVTIKSLSTKHAIIISILLLVMLVLIMAIGLYFQEDKVSLNRVEDPGILVSEKKYSEAAFQYDLLAKSADVTDPELLEQAAMLYFSSGEYKKSLDTYSELEQLLLGKKDEDMLKRVKNRIYDLKQLVEADEEI